MNQGPAKGRVDPVKLFAAVLFSDPYSLARARELLAAEFGPEDYAGEPVPFEHTDFYRDEMGGPLWRVFISWRRLVPPSALVGAKLTAERVEEALARPERTRTVNVDPGTVDYQKVVLASFKYMGQKIYLDKGVWADLTLYYRKGGWAAFEWTFPDFKLGLYDRTLIEIRKIYKRQMLERGETTA